MVFLVHDLVRVEHGGLWCVRCSFRFHRTYCIHCRDRASYHADSGKCLTCPTYFSTVRSDGVDADGEEECAYG